MLANKSWLAFSMLRNGKWWLIMVNHCEWVIAISLDWQSLLYEFTACGWSKKYALEVLQPLFTTSWIHTLGHVTTREKRVAVHFHEITCCIMLLFEPKDPNSLPFLNFPKESTPVTKEWQDARTAMNMRSRAFHDPNRGWLRVMTS